MKKIIFCSLFFLVTTLTHSQQYNQNYIFSSSLKNIDGKIDKLTQTALDSNTSFYNTNYSSLSAGYGNSYGGAGIKYEHRIDIVSFHAGVGYFPSPEEGVKESIFFSGGIKLFLIKDFYLNLQFGHLGIKYTKYTLFGYYTYIVEQKKIYGPSLLLGTTVWLNNSIGINGALGGSYNIVEIEWEKGKDKLSLAFDLGLTLKL